MSNGRSGIWGWVHDVGKSCGFAQPPQAPPMWVRANPDLFPQEVPGMSDDLLSQANQAGGSLEEKLQSMIDAFRSSARHLESLQQVLRRRALERREKAGKASFPSEVEEVISEGSYLDSFLEVFDGQTFQLYSEEIVPCHSYRLALEVHSGGAYWSGVPTQDANPTRQKVETVTASSPTEGTSTLVSQFGAAQRGAVFVWRWQHLLDQGPYNIPEWLSRAFGTEGNDPLRKLMGELEGIRRWEQQVKQDTAKHVKTGSEVKDPYIREVLRLWPTEPDPHGGEQLKKCAWVEGLDSRLFVGRQVVICKVPFDGSHSLTLQALIAKRHSEESSAGDSNPPYRLTATWHWTTPPSTNGAGGKPLNSATSLGTDDSLCMRPQDPLMNTAGSLASLTSSRATEPLQGTGNLERELTRTSDVTRPGSLTSLYRPGTSDGRMDAAAVPSAPSAVTYAGGYGGYAAASPISAPAPLLPAPPPRN
mmetsp:Transcript_135762/g.434327  ORF Transcript_135762/g.434327 Transcript_135762/m.434327 type:complete len:476 (+) Transcript_135762:770-2197(+)